MLLLFDISLTHSVMEEGRVTTLFQVIRIFIMTQKLFEILSLHILSWAFLAKNQGRNYNL